MSELLDNPVWHAITGPQRSFARVDGRAGRYQDQVAPFGALADNADPAAWSELAKLVEADGSNRVTVVSLEPAESAVPPGWTLLREIPAWQLVDAEVGRLARSASPDIVSLGAADVPEMLELIRLTEPGPFRTATVELGGYLGIRDQGTLVAMAGRRIRPAGWVEVSAVCTHPDFQGRGLARRILGELIAGIHDEGERAFLHVARGNPAAGLYRRFGFRDRRAVFFLVLQPA